MTTEKKIVKLQSSKKSPTVTVKLEYPIDFGDELIEEVELRRPKGLDIEHLSAKPSMKELLQIGQKISGYTPALFKKMDAVDCITVAEEVGNFLASGQKTGDNAW